MESEVLDHCVSIDGKTLPIQIVIDYGPVKESPITVSGPLVMEIPEQDVEVVSTPGGFIIQGRQPCT